MAVGERWMSSLWPFVHEHLPGAPARVLEIGCGEYGGFVPRLREAGYEATGVDPNAPESAGYHRSGFEEFEARGAFDAIVASRALHHVSDLGAVLARVGAALRPGGALIVVEWEWELFDESSARWCFERMDGLDDEPHWLQRRRDGWAASGESWDAYFQTWAAGHGLLRVGGILDELDARFDRRLRARGPYFFAELGVSEQAEQAAIDAGEVTATGVRYVAALSPD
jgi:SAM-dependent methyltransferase